MIGEGLGENFTKNFGIKFGVKGDRLTRIARMLEMLLYDELFTKSRMDRSFRVSNRTIVNDIKFLRSNELVNFVGNPRTGRFVITEKGKKMIEDLRQ